MPAPAPTQSAAYSQRAKAPAKFNRSAATICGIDLYDDCGSAAVDSLESA
jgi:hypothetical protein